MQSLEQIKQKKRSTEDLHSVVKTMKMLAAVNIRHYQRAVEALNSFYETIEMGFQIVMMNRPEAVTASRPHKSQPATGAIVFGSARGMCGQFNDLISDHAIDHLQNNEFESSETHILSIGERVRDVLESQSKQVEDIYSVPESLSEFPAVLQMIVLDMDRWILEEGVRQISIFYNKPKSGSQFDQKSETIFPIDMDWLQSLTQKDWPGRGLPTFTMDWTELFSSIVKNYFFAALYRAMAASLAAENASRLSAMQLAEKNIEERLDEITTQYNRQRQNAITAELLDVAAGYEAVTAGNSS